MLWARTSLPTESQLICRSPHRRDAMADNREEAIAVLNRLVELELAGTVRYTQYSLMIFGHARIPIMHWMRQQASEALLLATEAGEEVTAMGGRVSLAIAELAGTTHDDR